MSGDAVYVLGSFVVACSAKVRRMPGPGESLAADAVTIEAGGKGLNLALGARRLGAAVDGLIAVGNDAFADFAAASLDRADLAGMRLLRRAATTGAGIGFADPEGESSLAVHPGANALLAAADVAADADRLRASRMVLAQFEIGDDPIREAFRLAREAGRATLLIPSPYRAIDPEILARTAILVVNRVEAAALAEGLGLARPDPDRSPGGRYRPLAEALEGLGPRMVVVTLGHDGAVAIADGTPPLHQPAFPVDVVDTLGAGDAFAAGLATALIGDRPLGEALAVAAACGAITCTGRGVFAHLPTASELRLFRLRHDSGSAG